MPERVAQHPVITKYRTELVRFKTVHAGRRSFKTEIAKRTLVAEALKNKNQSLFFGAPTRDHAKRIAWKDLKELSPKWAVDKISDSELWIRYKTGTEIWVIGFDAPERFDGKSQWHGGVLDEYADMKEDVWTEHVEPALRDTRGWCWFIGVPEGKNHFYELSIQARNGTKSNWMDYSWHSSEAMHPEEIAEVKKHLDPRTFRQEYEGSFESYEGNIYCYYDADFHCVNRNLIYGLPLFVACDFNVTPCIWEIGQDRPDLTYVYDEVVGKNTDAFKMCVMLKQRLIGIIGDEGKAKSYPVRFYGDASGKSRDIAATQSTWEIIRQQFAGWNVEFRLQNSNPKIMDRVNAVNSRMRAEDGKIRFEHSPKCTELQKDFQMCELKDITTKKEQAGERTHASDSIGYMIYYEYPVLPKVTGTQYTN